MLTGTHAVLGDISRDPAAPDPKIRCNSVPCLQQIPASVPMESRVWNWKLIVFHGIHSNFYAGPTLSALLRSGFSGFTNNCPLHWAKTVHLEQKTCRRRSFKCGFQQKRCEKVVHCTNAANICEQSTVKVPEAFAGCKSCQDEFSPFVLQQVANLGLAGSPNNGTHVSIISLGASWSTCDVKIGISEHSMKVWGVILFFPPKPLKVVGAALVACGTNSMLSGVKSDQGQTILKFPKHHKYW